MLKSSLLLLFTALALPAVAALPTVSITDPIDGASWDTNPNLYVSAEADDVDGPVARVEFYLNDQKAGSVDTRQSGTLGTFAMYLSARPVAGSYSLTVLAYSSTGETALSSPVTVSITAPLPPPDVVTGSANPGAVQARVKGTVNPRNGYMSLNDYWVEYGLSTKYGAVSKTRVINSGGDFSDDTVHEVTQPMMNLQRNTTYHYRLVAKTQWGTAYGEDATVTTLANLPPVATDTFSSVNGTAPVPVYLDFSDPDNETVTVTALSTPAHGVVALGSSGPGALLTYTPDATFDKTDAFTYTVSDQHGASATATIHLYNPRKASAGRYVLTVISESAPVRAVGVVGLSVSSTGVFTGTLSYFGERHVLRGRFSTDGAFSTEIDRHGAPPLQLSLGEWGGPNGLVVGGSLDGYMITTDNALISPANAPEAGSYTMALPSEDPAAPLGSGYVTGQVGRHGQVIFTGRIGDGQAFSFGTQLRNGGTADLFVTAGTAPRDRIWGRLQFPGAAASESAGELAWYRAPRSSGAFQAGFQAQIQVTGSRLMLTDAEEQILEYSTELAGLDIHFTDLDGEDLLDGTLSGSSEQALAFQAAAPAFSTSARSPARAAVPPVTIKINRRTGAFTGLLHVPGESGPGHSYSGVLLQHQNTGTGLVRLGLQSGRITLTPK